MVRLDLPGRKHFSECISSHVFSFPPVCYPGQETSWLVYLGEKHFESVSC